MRSITYGKAIGEALHEEMTRDDSVFIMGEDVGLSATSSDSPKGSWRSSAAIG